MSEPLTFDSRPADEPKYTEYLHHNSLVTVRSDLKGKHREFCLCHSCAHLNLKDRNKNCEIATAFFALCVLTGCTTPIWECVRFEEK
jgi:hypothetical protein